MYQKVLFVRCTRPLPYWEASSRIPATTLTMSWTQKQLKIPQEPKQKTQCNFFRNYKIQYHPYYPETSWEDVHVPGINKSTFSHRNVCNVYHTAFCMCASTGGRHGSGLEKHRVSFFCPEGSLQMVKGLRF